MKLLEETIKELKGEDLEDDLRATVNLKVDFRLDDSYVPDMNQRLMIYRRMANARSEDEIGRLVLAFNDMLGELDRAELLVAEGRHKATGHLIVSAPAAELADVIASRNVVTPSAAIVSPTTNGLSSMIESAANRSPSTFWTARAKAMPLTPNPAISVVGLLWK